MGVKWFLVVLICISLITDHVEHLFTSLLSVCLLWRNVCWSPLPILNWVICLLLLLWICGSSLYIGDLNPFSDVSFADIFSHWLPFQFFDSVLWRTSRVGKLCWSPAYLWWCSFVVCAFGVISQKSLPNPVSWIFLPMFSSNNFLVLALKF